MTSINVRMSAFFLNAVHHVRDFEQCVAAPQAYFHRNVFGFLCQSQAMSK
jgi:hypothetical protein